MNVHEFQAKQLFAQYGVPVPRGKEITSPDTATAWANELNTPVFVVKAQIHAGGRGKAGGVKFCKSLDEVKAAAAGMLGRNMETYQSAGRALPVNLVLVTEANDIVKELKPLLQCAPENSRLSRRLSRKPRRALRLYAGARRLKQKNGENRPWRYR
ncbi:MAG: hypothetical protein HC938_08810 [Nitrospira sp.]|nr:hypothetical protein [Nitrospira sp.]